MMLALPLEFMGAIKQFYGMQKIKSIEVLLKAEKMDKSVDTKSV